MNQTEAKHLSLGIPLKNILITGGVFIALLAGLYLLVWQGRVLSSRSKKKEHQKSDVLRPAGATDAGLERLRARYSDLPQTGVAPKETNELQAQFSPPSKGVKRFFEKAKLESFVRAQKATLENGQHYRVSASAKETYQQKQKQVRAPSAPVTHLIPAGTIVPLLLLSQIHTNQQAPILGQTTRNIYSRSGKTLIPHGSKVIGSYDNTVQYGDVRVRVIWNTLVLPNGKSIPVGGAAGIDSQGTAGLAGDVNNHWGKLIAGVVLTSTLSSSAQVTSGRRFAVEPRFGDLALQGGAQALNRSGQQIIRREINVAPTILVHQGTEGSLFFEKELSLPEYNME